MYVFAAAVGACMCLIFPACLIDFDSYFESYPDFEDREAWDFIVRFYDDYCEIKGTTEQGNNQRFLVVPAYIDGLEVQSWGAYNPLHDFTMTGSD